MLEVQNKIKREDLGIFVKFIDISTQKIDYSKTFFKNEKNYNYLDNLFYNNPVEFNTLAFFISLTITIVFSFLSIEYYNSEDSDLLLFSVPIMLVGIYLFYFNCIKPIFIRSQIIDYITSHIDSNYEYNYANLRSEFTNIRELKKWTKLEYDSLTFFFFKNFIYKIYSEELEENIYMACLAKGSIDYITLYGEESDSAKVATAFVDDDLIFITTIIYLSNVYFCKAKEMIREDNVLYQTISNPNIYNLIFSLLYFYLFNNYKYDAKIQYKNKEKVILSKMLEDINKFNKIILPKIDDMVLLEKVIFLEKVILMECDDLKTRYEKYMTESELKKYSKESMEINRNFIKNLGIISQKTA